MHWGIDGNVFRRYPLPIDPLCSSVEALQGSRCADRGLALIQKLKHYKTASVFFLIGAPSRIEAYPLLDDQ